MKSRFLTVVLGIFFLLLTVGLFGQKNPIGVSFKRLFLDYQTLQGGSFGAFQDYRDGFEFGVHLPLSKYFEVNIPVKIGLKSTTDEVINQQLYGVDAQLHWFFLRNPNRYRPYLLAGVGGVYAGEDSVNVQTPVGIGLDIKLAKYAYLNLLSEFRWSSEEDNYNFHHGIGFKYYFGPAEPDTVTTDTDLDGIVDEFDACPTVPGVASFAGCPYTDGDGVQDSVDHCPIIPGLIELHGCPDSDNDGIADSVDDCPYAAGPASNKGCPLVRLDTDMDGVPDDVDACPTMPGLAMFNGCPDSDGDGIEDTMDKCPSLPGIASFQGCPDTDNDGLEDSKDKCPNTYGPISNQGCPVIEEKDKEVLSFAMKAVQFELGKATLKSESYSVLNQIVNIMNKYPDYNLKIEGHTDNTGSNEVNQKLSTERAKSCFDYLKQKGIPESRMSYKGFGPSRPIADNSTYSGRTLNRRVEFNLTPDK